METLKILMSCVAAAVIYGVLHDQVTARVCVEYFTIGHPDLFGTESPTLLALGWGVIATWWVGLILGIPLALSARGGSWPALCAKDLIRPLMLLLIGISCVSLSGGIGGYLAETNGWVSLVEPMNRLIDEAKKPYFVADQMAHRAAYGGGFAGGLLLCGWAIAKRRQLMGLRPDHCQQVSVIERCLLCAGAVLLGSGCLVQSMTLMLIFNRPSGFGLLEVFLAILADVFLFVSLWLWDVRRAWMIVALFIPILWTLIAIPDAVSFP